MRVLGIDLGSREVKIMIMEDHVIIQKMKISTMEFYRDYCSYNGKIIVNFEKLCLGSFDICVSTGYGRNNVDLDEFLVVNEIKAHAQGALFQTQLDDFILLDVGGQDVKVMKIEHGVMMDLALNDKCAASCGRYLENMANILEIDTKTLAMHVENPIILNSTCAVFSESELIGMIAEGVKLEHLCAGVNYSLYKRIQPLLSKFKSTKLVVVGGVAYNEALISYLGNNYEQVICVVDPQFNGAIGSCILGMKELTKKVQVY